MPLALVILAIALALIGHSLAGSLGAGIGLLLAIAIGAWAEST